MKFKNDDKVKYVSGKYGDTESNPLWNGCYGKIEGTIIENSYGWFNVYWDNGLRNGYEECDLEHIESDIDIMFNNLIIDIMEV